ncbi:hypothetical protein N665_2250s0005 [Sinapis alba]|nr:hypothetical protein N665_2250s0005 [Sinapis alba]
MNSPKRNFIYILCSIVTISITVASFNSSEPLQPDGFFVSYATLSIYNCNNFSMGIHCKSGDKDKGFRVVNKGGLYEFRIRIGLQKTTLFFCGFTHGNVKKGIFDIYDASRDSDRCDKCTWKAVGNGIYGYTDKPHQAVLFYKWLK